MIAKRALVFVLAVALLGSAVGCGRRCFCRDNGVSYSDRCDSSCP